MSGELNPQMSFVIVAEVSGDPLLIAQKQRAVSEALRQVGATVRFLEFDDSALAPETCAMYAGIQDIESASFQGRLETNVTDAQREARVLEARVIRTGNALGKEGLHTLRDLLVVGKKAVRGIRNCGSTIFESIETTLEVAVPELAWQDEPDIALVARLCPTLAHVPSQVLPDPWLRWPKLSVQDILSMPSGELEAHIAKYYHSKDPEFIPKRTGEMRQAAERFKNLFEGEQARQRMARESE